MGWINKEEQKRLHTTAEYLCDHCDKPILGEAPVIDPKKGYYPWPENTPDGMKMLRAREPKCTYHYQCDREMKGKTGTSTKPKIGKRLEKVVAALLKRITSKPELGYWTKEKCIQKLKDDFDKRAVLKAIRWLRDEKQLKKKEGGYLPV